MRRRNTGVSPAIATTTAHPEWARIPSPVSVCGMIGLQVPGKESPDLLARFPGGLGVDAVEVVASGRVVVDLVFELLALGLERGDQVLHLQHVHVFVVG